MAGDALRLIEEMERRKREWYQKLVTAAAKQQSRTQ